jgi:hypothetical protein
MSHAGGYCNCTGCSRLPHAHRWKSISTLRRHAVKDLEKLLRKHQTVVEGDALVDAERDGCFDNDAVVDEDVPEPVDSSSDEDSDEGGDDEADAVDDEAGNHAACADVFEHKIFDQWREDLNKATEAKEPVDAEDGDPDKVLVGELLLTYFEWMCVHKPTNECAKAVHKLISLVLPPDSHNLPSWGAIHKMLDIVYNNVCEEVDICPNDCIAFRDATHPVLIRAGYKHAHRTCCPQCGAARYKPVDESGTKIPVKRGYYFPIDTFVSSIFRDKVTEEFRTHTTGECPSGHHRRSRGFYDKVTNNPKMNKDDRNQAFIGTHVNIMFT